MVLPFNYCFNFKCSFCYFSTSLLVCLFVCLFACLLIYLFNFSFIYVIVNLNEQFCNVLVNNVVLLIKIITITMFLVVLYFSFRTVLYTNSTWLIST